MVIGTSVVIALINVIACIIFDKITYLEAKKTKVEEPYSKFVKITIIQFVNISIIILLINFNLNGVHNRGAVFKSISASQNNLIFQIFPVLNGADSDFSV